MALLSTTWLPYRDTSRIVHSLEMLRRAAETGKGLFITPRVGKREMVEPFLAVEGQEMVSESFLGAAACAQLIPRYVKCLEIVLAPLRKVVELQLVIKPAFVAFHEWKLFCEWRREVELRRREEVIADKRRERRARSFRRRVGFCVCSWGVVSLTTSSLM